MKPPLLVIGSNGQLARALVRACERDLRDVTAQGRDALDLADAETAFRRINSLAPAAIINAAAYTAVDAAECEPEMARAINVAGARAVARAARACGARLVHVSTDYVFSGQTDRPYEENDEPHPLSVYGASKREGEIAVRETAPDAAIVRTSAIFSETGTNFVKTMVRISDREEINVVADQVTGPTPADELAKIILTLLDTNGSGIFHAAGKPAVSWADFAEAIFGELSRHGRSVPVVNRVTSEQFGAPAARPAYSVLADTRLSALIGHVAIDWRPALARTIDALVKNR